MRNRTLITGSAGFIGAHLTCALLERGHHVVGIDNLNDYYDPKLKLARLKWIGHHSNFRFQKMDVTDAPALAKLCASEEFDTVVHLAAQAGVRYSIQNPLAFGRSNLIGHLSLLEAVRSAKNPPFLVYASSSSVYGNKTPLPFREDVGVSSPESLYAATKMAAELMSESYTNLYGLQQVGLRFFTVYGPWGRPDMAYWIFASKIMRGKPINLFNGGELERDFTWIGDIVDGIVRVVDGGKDHLVGGAMHRIYNVGNSKSVSLLDFVGTIERSLGVSANKILSAMQSGDVYRTVADINALQRDYGYEPHVSLDVGVPEFCKWFLSYATTHESAESNDA